MATTTADTSAIRNAAVESVKTAKKMSLKTKILAGIAGVAAVGAVAILAVLLSTGGKNNPPNGGDMTPDLSPTVTESANPTFSPVSESPELSATPTADPSLSDIPSASPSPTPTTSGTPTPQSTETSYAYITDWSERMDIYQNYAFDYVDWLTGKEAVDKYMQDHPGVSKSEAEEKTQEAGYIRNVNTQLRWFAPNSSTKYYLPDDNLVNKKVNYEAFRDTIIPAIENNETWLTFVKVTASGETIVKVEWTYLP